VAESPKSWVMRPAGPAHAAGASRKCRPDRGFCTKADSPCARAKFRRYIGRQIKSENSKVWPGVYRQVQRRSAIEGADLDDLLADAGRGRGADQDSEFRKIHIAGRLAWLQQPDRRRVDDSRQSATGNVVFCPRVTPRTRRLSERNSRPKAETGR